MKPYHIKMIQVPYDADKIALLRAAEVLLEITNIDPNVMFFVSAEATFHVYSGLNNHNCVSWSTDTRSSPKVNPWWVTLKFGVLGPYSFNDQSITADSYLNILQNFVVSNLLICIITFA